MELERLLYLLIALFSLTVLIAIITRIIPIPSSNNQKSLKTPKTATNNTMIPNEILEINVDETCIPESLTIVLHEYDIERNKRASFENRNGMVLATASAIIVFILEKIPIDFSSFKANAKISDPVALKPIIGLFVYALLVLALFTSIKSLLTRKYENFDVSKITESFMGKKRIIGNVELIAAYRKITLAHRTKNENDARLLNISFTLLALSLTFAILYFAL